MNREPKAIGRLTAVLLILLFNGAFTVAGSFMEITQDLTDPQVLLLDKISQVIGVIITFILPAVLIVYFLSPSRYKYLGLGTTGKPAYYLLACVLILVALPFIGAMEEWNRHLTLPSSWSGVEAWMRRSEDNASKQIDAMLKAGNIGDLLLNLFTIAFMAAVSEEIFFRGLIQNVCREWFPNYHAAIWFTAILFSAFHMEFYGFLPRMALGLALGYLYAWSGSLYVSMLAHFANNAYGVIMFYLIEHKVVQTPPDTPADSGTNWLATGISIVLTGGLLFVAYRMRKQEVIKDEEPKDQLPGYL